MPSETIDRVTERVERTGTVTVRVTIPAALLDEYELQAHNRTVEAVMSERLVDAVGHTASKPLYFDDDQRQQLERALGRNVLHTSDALMQIRHAMQVRVQKIAINLKLNLLQKLKSRCIGQPWEKFIEERIVHALEQYVGMR